MPLYIDPCGALNAQSYCNSMNGQPTSPVTQVGTGSPEDVVVGLAVGLHQYWDSEADKMYIFGGTVGEDTGWVILN